MKKEILERIKHCPAPPFLFIGSGFSQRYIGTPTWKGLLSEFTNKISEDLLQYTMYVDEAKRSNNSNGELPKIAELLEGDFNRCWFSKEKFLDNRRKHEKIVLEDEVSPFKIEISEYFKFQSKKKFCANMESEIELFKLVGNRSLGGIITTNYDTLIERLFTNYKYTRIIGQEELIFTPITGISEIYKIHGCCTKPQSLVINDKDYDKFNEKNAYLTAKLLTIFLEHPIIFIGYSISDTNIREILASIAKCLPKEKIEMLKDRFIFIEWNNTEKADSITEYEFSNLSDNKSIKMTKIFVKDYSCIYSALLESEVKYNPRLIKKLKEDIYNVVLQSDPTKTLNVLLDIDDDRLNEVEVVVGVGIMKKLGITGYDGVKPEELFEDIVFNNKNFDKKYIVEKSLPLILKYNQSIPIYKYVNGYEGEMAECIKKKLKKQNTVDDYLSKTIKKQIKIKEYSDISFDEYIARVKEKDILKTILSKKFEVNDAEKLLEFIKKYIEINPDCLESTINKIEKTDIKRLIKIYDILKYK